MNEMTEFEWEVIPMEGEPFLITTATDSLLAAAQRYEEHYAHAGKLYGIRKFSKTQKTYYEEAI